jgi:predicted deacylase
MKIIKRKLGYFYRGIKGFFGDKVEKIPQIPKEIHSIKIGESVNGKNIWAYKIGEGQIKFAFGGGIHGNEVGTVKFIKQLVNFIYLNKDNYKDFTFYFIPIINPDGYEIGIANPDYFHGGNIGRFNANNVDLNKNFPTKSFNKYSVWSRGDSYTESKKVYCGEYGGSEPENNALTRFLLDNKVQIFFNYHSSGGDVQANQIPLSVELNKIYSQACKFGNWPEEEWKKLGQTGTAKEWCEENNIAFSEIENTGRWGSDWERQKPAIVAILKYLVHK